MRTRIHLLAGLLAAAVFGPAAAQSQAVPADWPKQPIKIVVGFAPGTAPDVFARMYAEFVSRKLNTPVVIDNKPGAAGNLASDLVAKAQGDGYTLLYNLSTGFTINPYIYAKLPFDPAKDLVPVATTMRQGLVLIAKPGMPAKTAQELVAAAKAKPGAIAHGSYGAGSPSHLIMEWFKDETRTDMNHIPYRASPLADVAGGQLDTAMEPIATGMQMITAGRVQAIAYSGPTRHPGLPNVPTMSEIVPGLAMTSWHGIWAPGTTPPALLERLNAAFVEASKDPGVAGKIRDIHSEPLGLSRAEMSALLKRDAEIYGRIAKAKNIKVD